MLKFQYYIVYNPAMGFSLGIVGLPNVEIGAYKRSLTRPHARFKIVRKIEHMFEKTNNEIP